MLLLFWAYNKRLPKTGEWDEDFAILIDAWALGQELAVPAFQDAIMLELLNWHAEFEIDFLAYVCEKLEPGSEISRFFAEEAVYAVGIEGIGLEDDGDLSDDGMDVGEEEHLARLDPAMSDLLAVAQSSEECRRADARFSKYGWGLFERYEQGRVEGRRWWMEFMVSPKGKQGVHGGPNGAVTSCFEEETLAQAVNRVCDEEEMMNTAVVREKLGGEDGDSEGDEVEAQEDGAAKVVDERSDPETGHDCCEIAIDEE